MTTARLRLLRGDKRNPTEVLDLNSGAVRLRFSGFAPGAGDFEPVWSGRNPGRDGQRLVLSSRDNAVVSLAYDLVGGSLAQLMQVQRDINRFLRRAETEPVWLEYNWSALDVPAPVLGQWSSYIRVYAPLEIAWPETLHSPALEGAGPVVESVRLTLACAPYIEGLRQQAGDTTAQPGSTITWSLASELSADFTVGGWVTMQAGDFTVWSYTVDANNSVRVDWDSTAGAFVLVTRVAGQETTVTGQAQSLSAGAAVHVVTVNVDGALTVYVNGAVDINGAGQAFGSGGSLALLGAGDGWRVWDAALDAASVAEIYEGETEIKTAGGRVGALAWLNDSGNWAVVGGVSGDAPALTEWRLTPAQMSTSRVYWLGRAATDSQIAPDSTFLFDFNASSTTTGTGTDSHDFSTSADEVSALQGRVQALAHLKVDGDSADVYAYYRLGASGAVTGDTARIATDANLILRDLGDLFVNWPQSEAPASLGVGVVCEETSPTALTLGLEEVWLLPYPLCRVECESATFSVAAGDVLVIDGLEAYVLAADGSQKYRFGHRGDEVTLEPGQYNYVIVLPGEEGQQYTAQAVGLAVYITPRWHLPGGPVN